MAATLAVNQLLGKLAEQHERFMAEVAEDSIRVLQIENRRLMEELELLRKMKGVSGKARTPPPIPQLPKSMGVLPAGFELENQLAERHKPGIPARPHTAEGKLANGSNKLLRDGAYVSTGSLPLQLSTAPSSRIPGTVADDGIESVAISGKGLALKRSRSQAMIADPAFTHLHEKYRSKHRRRIRELLGIDVSTKYISPDNLFPFVMEREPMAQMTYADIAKVLDELKSLDHSNSGMNDDDFAQEPDSMNLIAFVDVMLQPDLLSWVQPELRNRVSVVSRALFRTTLAEVIDNATRGARERDILKEQIAGPVWETYLNLVVSVTVVCSLIFMGTSIDFHPDHYMWVVLEVMCGSVFFAEMCIKLCKVGCRDYFTGRARYWNILDFGVTWLSVFEIGMAVWEQLSLSTADDGQKAVEAARIGLVMRALRMTRVVRLIKLLRSPVLKELANMLVGFVIGLPALCWVLVLFLIVLYMMGLLFRIVLGPAPGQNMIDICGLPDDFIDDGSRPNCRVHWMYGEEFFSSVKLSMFTTFRFMIGDYSTRGGKSLAVIFSQEYGDPFHFTFCCGMITVMFGLFNIITAIFVDTTVAGLKHNDTKRKYARQYERQYVQEKLKGLIGRIGNLLAKRQSVYTGPNDEHPNLAVKLKRMSTAWRPDMNDSAAAEEDDGSRLDGMTLTEEEFVEVMEDSEVKDFLQDLDVEMLNPSAVFDTFDPDADGNVTVTEMVHAIIKLRGDAQKNDIVASMLSLKRLNEKFDKFQMLFMESLNPEDTPLQHPTAVHQYHAIKTLED